MDIHSIQNRCQYRNCKNGKYNNSKLFTIPLDLERQKIWINCTGNHSLLTLKQTAAHAYRICFAHFRKRDILIGKRGFRLRQGANPVHWKEVLDDDEKLDYETMKAIANDFPINTNTLKPKEKEAEIQCEDLQMENDIITQDNNFPITANTTTPEENEAEIQCEDLQIENDIIIQDNNFPMTTNTTTPEENEAEIQCEDLQMENDIIIQGNNFFMTTNTTTPEENEAEMQYEDLQVKNNISSPGNAKNIIPEKRANHCTIQCRILNITLQNQVKRLEEENNNLKMNLRKLKKKCSNIQYKNKQLIAKKSKKFCIDEYLEKNNVSHLSQTMIKLQLHKTNSIFTKDERDLAKQLYQNSPSAYCKLRDSGLNLPSSSVVRRWIAETEVCPDV